jgi:hypothetical protein
MSFMKYIVFLIFAITLVLWKTGCSNGSTSKGVVVLKPFSTDGCSLFPDGTFSDKDKWQDCCIEHDIAYWKGGTEQDRLDADLELKRCIFERTGDAMLAQTVYDAVRTWGSPIFPAWYRWGYGWPYGRGYEPLTEEEQRQVNERLREYDERSE